MGGQGVVNGGTRVKPRSRASFSRSLAVFCRSKSRSLSVNNGGNRMLIMGEQGVNNGETGFRV
jgi:hypothetical protein